MQPQCAATRGHVRCFIRLLMHRNSHIYTLTGLSDACSKRLVFTAASSLPLLTPCCLCIEVNLSIVSLFYGVR